MTIIDQVFIIGGVITFMVWCYWIFKPLTNFGFMGESLTFKTTFSTIDDEFDILFMQTLLVLLGMVVSLLWWFVLGSLVLGGFIMLIVWSFKKIFL